LCNAILPSFEFGELRLETGFGGGSTGHYCAGSISLQHGHSKSCSKLATLANSGDIVASADATWLIILRSGAPELSNKIIQK
jgi:hypothetical protein